MSDVQDGGPRTRPIEGDGPARVRRFRLVASKGPDAGLAFASASPRTVVGSHESADLRLGDPTVSRFHCEIEIVDGRARLRDLGSSNGTRVDGVAVVEAYLDGPALLALGHSELRFDLGTDEVEVTLSPETRFGGLVGRSPGMRAVFALLERCAATGLTVLLQGETGTGKDAAAESIHSQGARRKGPFAIIDCGSIPRALIESELFGHERGAFTGATSSRAGAFEMAAGGTLFIDEIGELPLDLQPRLLRVLEQKEVQRVGGSERRAVDVRVIAATNRNLRTEVNAGRFRSDLFYRLAVLEVTLPPLRERRDDLLELVDHLLEEMGVAARPEAAALRTARFVQGLARHAWPGNVRELKNYLQRCLAVASDLPPVPEEDPAAPPALDFEAPFFEVRDRWLRHVERRYLEELLRRHDGNVTAAARAARMDRVQFYRVMSRCGIVKTTTR